MLIYIVGLRIMMDTMLGNNDNAPFRVPQYGSVTTETEFEGDDIPQFWQAFDSLTSPTVIAQGRLYQTEKDRPDKVQFCNWRSINGVHWDYRTTPNKGNGDSAVALTWNEAALAPNETREYVTYYGLSEFTEDLSLPLGLSVYSDSELSVVNNQYAPNPVDVTAYVQNLSSSPAEEVRVSIELPDNLTLTNDSEKTIELGTMNANQLEQTSWSVYVSPSAQDTTYQYTVVLTAADGYEKRVSRSIRVPAVQTEIVSPYILFSGSDASDFTLNCWQSTFNGDIYTGSSFISNASELYLNGNVDAVDFIRTYGWKVNINERNEHIEKEEMPDWDARILKMAENCETSDEDIVKIEDKNVVDGALRTSGNVVISGTTFDGNCYIIADGNITYNVNDFKSTGHVVLYSRNGNITIKGTNIDVNGILYASNGKVRFYSNIANINGRIFADEINFNGSIFNVNGSDSDWELLGRKAVISKTYTVDADFDEGEYDELGIDVHDELTLSKRETESDIPDEKSYKVDDSTNGIELVVKTDKTVLSAPDDMVDVEFDLNGFGSEEVEENNVDLAIVVDTSGSMSGSRRSNAVAAAKEVISRMKPNDRSAVIKFANSASVLQDFTSDKDLLNTAADKLNASGGTNIASGINKALEYFDKLEDNSRQKFIILLSDGEDSSKSAQAALDAYEKGIRIFALAVGKDSNQMKTISENSHGIYLNSPTADQINEMMQQFAEEVFNNAGKDVSFDITVAKDAVIDEEAISPKPSEVIENEDGTRTYRWKYDTITIDGSEKIKMNVSVSDLESGMFDIADDIACTYYNRGGESATIFADDIIMPVHDYNSEGTWNVIYDSKTSETEWTNIIWNGKLHDDGKMNIKARAGDDADAMGEWKNIDNYEEISGLKGRYAELSVTMEVSSTGKTPELFDITLLSDGSELPNYVNNAPEISIKGKDYTNVDKKLTLYSEAADDAFCSQLSYEWSCESDKVTISDYIGSYTSFKFDEPGEYVIKLNVSDGNSDPSVEKTVKVYGNDVVIKPMIEIEAPDAVKSGSTVSGKIVKTNAAEITGYTLTVNDTAVEVEADGCFSFEAPEEDGIIAITAKAAGVNGVDGKASKAIAVDGKAPVVGLKADAESIFVRESATISAVMNDDNGIKSYTATLDGEKIELDANYQFVYIPESAGDHVFALTVEDNVGNVSETTVTIKVSEKETGKQPVVDYVIPRAMLEGAEAGFKFTSADENAVITVKANGEVVTLDSNGEFCYTVNEPGTLTLDIHAENGSGKDTDFTLEIPVYKIELVGEKNVFDEFEFVELKLVTSDNLKIADQLVTIDDKEFAVSGDTVQADGLAVGTHELKWFIESDNGASFAATYNFEVIDRTAPEVSVSFSETNLYEGDDVTAEITAADAFGIKSIKATFDGKTVAVEDNKVQLKDLTSGEHVLSVDAVDNNGNGTVVETTFTVFKAQSSDTTPPQLTVDVTVEEDNRIKITAEAEDESGEAVVKKAKKVCDGTDEAAAKLIKKAKKSGITDEAMELIFDNCKNIDDIKPLFKKFGQLNGEVQKKIAKQLGGKCDDFFKALKNYKDDVIDNFLKRFEKDGDKLLEKLAGSDMIDDAIEIITKYGDDGAAAVAEYGDDAVKLANRVLDPDDALSKMSEEIDFSRANDGKGKPFSVRTKLDTFPNKSEYTVSERVVNHSDAGDFTNYKDPKHPEKGGGLFAKGGHGQGNIDELKNRGIAYNIEKEYPNGVRVGNVPSHKETAKKTGIGQAWFPKDWTAADIEKAGQQVLADRTVAIENVSKGKPFSYTVFGEYKGVTVGVTTDINGTLIGDNGTIFPDNLQRSMSDFLYD